MAIAKNRDLYQKKMRPQSSMAEYISQKKDIFRVELVNTSIQKQIRDISAKDKRRELAMVQSKSELDNDRVKALEFLKHKDFEEKKAKEERDRLQKSKQDRDDKIRELDHLI